MKTKILILSILLILISNTSFSKSKNYNQKYIFIQEATSGDLIKNKDNTYQLSMESVSPMVIYFYNGPKRIANYMPINEHMDILKKTFNRKNQAFLNAALIGIEADTGKLSDYIISLSNPHYSDKCKSVKYGAKFVLPKYDLPRSIHFKQMVLYIDDVCVSCGAGG